MKKTVGFLGTGNIANAIMDGMVSSRFLCGEDIGVYDLDKSKAEKCSDDYKVTVFETPDELVKNCSAVIFAVKPNVLPTVLRELDKVMCEENTLIISVAAGTELKSIEDCLSQKLRIVRVMPNINAKVSEAISAICANDEAGEDDIAFTEKIFNSAGKTVRLEENLFSAFCAAAGSAPAFAYIYLDSIARAAVKNGAYKSEALKLASELMLRKAEAVFSEDEDIETKIAQIKSENSAGSKVIETLEKNGFYEAVANAVDKTVEKDMKMKNKK